MTSESDRIRRVENERPTDMSQKYAKIQAETGWVPGLGFKKDNDGINNSANKTENRINDVNTGGFNTAVTGTNATGVSSAQGQQDSSSQNQQESNSSAYREKAQFSAIAQAKDASQALKSPNQVSFDFVQSKGDDQETKSLQKAVMTQYEQRYGMNLSQDVKDAIYSMTDKGDLKAALKVMAQGKRADIADPQVNALEATILNAHSDFFSAVDAEAIRKQQAQYQ